MNPIGIGRSWEAGVILALVLAGISIAAAAAPTAPGSPASKATGEEMEVQIKGQFKGRFMVKKIVAPVTMNLEKLQDFPEDPSRKILLDPLPISPGTGFNSLNEIKAHLPFHSWIPPLPEPPFLRMVPPKGVQAISWMFEVFNPQGQTIFRQRGTNALPDELIWEGKDSEKKFAVVDRLYSAQLTLTGPEDKTTVVQGESVILPAMVYGSAESETVEVSLSRLFLPGKAEFAPEGMLMLNKICEGIRERGLTKLHIRIQGSQESLNSQREVALVEHLQKNLILSPGQVEHDHTNKAGLRGEIAIFWLKRVAP